MSFFDNFNGKKNIIAAHRGARSLRAENTMSAFKEAIKKKSDFIELDVGFSKDGVAVIIHDDTLERTSNVKKFCEFKNPYRVVDYTYKDLLKLDFSSWFIKDDPFGTIKKGIVSKNILQAIPVQKISTLREVLIFFKEQNFPVNVEIKDMGGTEFDKTAVEKIIEIIKNTGMDRLVLLSSFNHQYMREAYKSAPAISRAALQETGHHENLVEYLKELNVQGYNPDFKIADKDTIAELNQAGFFVNIFTVNNKKDKKESFERGAKSIFTDFLD